MTSSGSDGGDSVVVVATMSARDARRAELQQWTHAQLVERLIDAEEEAAMPAQVQPAAAHNTSMADAAPSAAPSSPAGAAAAPSSSSSSSSRKHAHSPRPLEGEPPAKQTRCERRKEHRRAEMEKAEAGAHSTNKGAVATATNASDETNDAASSSAAAAAGGSAAEAGSVPSTSGADAASSNDAAAGARGGKGPKPRKKQDEFDWSRVHRRHIALKLMYIGTEYAGFAIQPQIHSERTVEGELIRALLLTKLAPERDAARLTRCGRTDKGVHSSGQVVSVQVRSRLTHEGQIGMLARGHEWREELARANMKKREFMDSLQPAAGDTSLFDKQGFLAPAPIRDSMCLRCGLPGVGFASDADCSTHEQELDYCRMLNSVLPPTIRIVSWQPVSTDFNARFSCTARTYRYFFHADQLSLERMQAAATAMLGSHDFRNFCKIDPSMSTHFTRCLTNIEVRSCDTVPEDCVQITSPWPCTQEQWFEDVKNCSGGKTEEEEEEEEQEEAAQRNNNSEAASSTAAAAASSTPSPTPPASTPRLHPDTLCELLIHGNAFLYHQVRCMAAILFLVGRGVEDVDLVARMLDVEATPNKPNYDMAPESPLVLYDTCFPALPLTPGFDYQTRPATRPDDQLSFVGLAARQQTEMNRAELEKAQRQQQQQQQQSQQIGQEHTMVDASNGANATDAPTSVAADSVSASPSAAAAAAAAAAAVDVAPPAAATSSVAAAAAVDPSPSPAAVAASPSPAGPSSSPSPPLNLYPSAALSLRNEEIVFAHFHRLWRALSMDAKVHELFLNQCARNLQSVRNECAKLDMQKLQQTAVATARAHFNKRVRHPSHYQAPASVGAYAPLLAATASCRGHGLRGMPNSMHSHHAPILRRPTEKSYDDKVRLLKGKKLARHHNVKEMSDKFKKVIHAPIMHKMEQ